MTLARLLRFRLPNTYQQRRCLQQDSELLRRVENMAMAADADNEESQEIHSAAPAVTLADAGCDAAPSDSAGFAGLDSENCSIKSAPEMDFAVSAGTSVAQIRITCVGEDDADWPDLVPIVAALPRVEEFRQEYLPTSFRPLVADISERMGTPLDFAAAAAIVALAGCVNRRCVIIPKVEDDSWRVTPNLWGAVIASPGFMKSPVTQAVTSPLKRIEEGWRDEYETLAAEYQGEAEKSEITHQAWREQYKSRVKKNCTPPEPPEGAPNPPRQKRLLGTDLTFEKLHEILYENPSGILVIRDELTGWLAELDRSGREGERAFYLQSWNGDTGFHVDRIGRGSIYVPAVCVSLFGLIQPARLRAYVSDSIAGGPTDDGLFQRFQILVWPDTKQDWELVDRRADLRAIEVAGRVYSTLANLPSDNPIVLRFAPDSQRLFFEFWGELERKIRSESGLHPAIVAHLSKYRSLMPTLAGLFELADAVEAGISLSDARITLDHAKQAAALCSYLESHANRVYGCLVTPEIGLARELAQHLKASHLPPVFTTREIYNKGWRGLDSPDSARAALRLLEEFDWVQEIAEAATQGKRGGLRSSGRSTLRCADEDQLARLGTGAANNWQRPRH